ncbi:protein shisa-like-1a [Oncorhynchus mykiss]|uniref:protein shisa-like-1a n=1 Tax=Oncorhynchus mykiss TaxID=8022 RepID=UPI000B4F84BC|nr:protein shisa-like-1a [Oncorhynchus mykiss]XP_036833036.1 protein shisa-like-1a [Oncorhynchus mykiss]
MLCEAYSDHWGGHHTGFHCPRLSDPPDLSFCCWLGEGLGLKQCCPRSQYHNSMNSSQTGTRVNSKEPVYSYRSLFQTVVLLYGSLVLVLMLVDFLWFCRARGLSVTAALTRHVKCPRWISSLLFPYSNKTQQQLYCYHGNGRDSQVLGEHKIPQDSSCL